MRKVFIIEDNPDFIKKLLDIFLPQEKGESFKPEWDVTICTTEEGAKSHLPSTFDYILIDHDLPDRGNGGRILNFWNSHLSPWSDGFRGRIKKIVAISSVPVNNKRLTDLGADVAVDKMDPSFEEKLKEAIK